MDSSKENINFTEKQKEIIKWLNDEVFKRNVNYFPSYLRNETKKILDSIK